jgi:hypothetical protein
VLASFWKANTLMESVVCSEDREGEDGSFASEGSSTADIALSKSFSKDCRVAYADCFTRFVMVVVPSEASFGRFDSDSPDTARVVADTMGRSSIEGFVS